MKVCMVSTAPPRLCGIANYSIKLAKALSMEKCCQLVVVADYQNFTPKNLIESGEHVNINRAWTFDSFRYPFEIFRTILFEEPDVIHIHHEYLLFGSPYVNALFPFLLFLLHLLRKHIVITIHSVIRRNHLTTTFFRKYGLENRLGTLAKFYLYFLTLSIGYFASKVIVHLKSAKRALVEDYKFKPNSVSVIPHGVDFYKMSIDTHKAKRELDLTGKKVLLFFGFIEPKKGIEYLIQAMPLIRSRYADVVLMIIGNCHPNLTPNDVEYPKQLRTFAHELRVDDNILFESRFVPNDELILYFAASDIAIFPYTEPDIIGASGALSSVMSFKKPVVATRVGRFIDDIKNGEEGLLVSPADSKSLAEAVISIFSDPELKRKLSENLFNKAEERRWERIAWKTSTIYNTLLETCT